MRNALFVSMMMAGLAPLSVGCDREAEATPPESTVDPGAEVAPDPELRIEERTEAMHDDVLTPGENGVIEPTEDRVIMPPDIMSKPEDTNIDTPDPSDQLERDRVEEAEPF